MAESSSASRPAVIVALGASGAAAQSLEAFLGALPRQPRAALVIVLQHHEALNEERFTESLKAGGWTLSPVADGAPIEADRLYLAPMAMITTIEKDRFRLRPAEQKPGERGTLDSFLVSLGEEEAKSLAVLFAETGGDGTLGAGALKASDGLVLAERTEEHSDPELAISQSPAALADVLLPPSELAERVSHYISRLADRPKPVADPDPPEAGDMLRTIAGILRNKTGHDFHGYKPGTFLRRVQRRMQVVDAPAIEAYLEVLRNEPGEAQNLFNDLLIGVTQFFRDKREFEVIEREVIPKLFENKTRNDQVRVWVIGCSTGEEAYSLAILLREHMTRLDEVPQVQIFASDLDGRALASARVGRYSESISGDLSPERLARWFVREGNTYCVTNDLRELCIFSQHSVIKDAPFSRLDLVSCRNLLIYLDAELQSRVIPLFHFALKSGGFLFLGNSENVSRHAKLFEPVESRTRIYRRLDTPNRVLPDFPFTSFDRRPREGGSERVFRAAQGGLARHAERVAERYMPSYLIIDEDFTVLHFSGNTGRFLDPARGTASLNILNLVRPDLRLDLHAGLSKAQESGGPIEIRNVQLNHAGARMSLDLVVEPVEEAGRRHYVLLFKEGTNLSNSERSLGGQMPSDERVLRLEADLRSTAERLQATVEELETTNEELKSANEEYQSLNEELQSANEELETSKEELQSINEELTTVNGELAHRVQELGRANNDLKNLLESTQIATVFLDNEMRVMNFTPTATDIFPLVESDIGRSITHIRGHVPFEELQDDVRRVLRTLGLVEREIVSATTGTRYMVRVLPYRSIDNFIGGVVITFTNLTPLSLAQAALRESEARFRAVADLVPDLLWSSEPSGNATWFNRRWLDFTGQSLEEAFGSGWTEAVHPEDRDESRRNYQKAIEEGSSFTQQHRMRRADGSYRWFLVRAEPTRDETGQITQWFGSATDIHEQRLAIEAAQSAEAQTRLLLSELQHRVRNTLAVVRSMLRRTAANAETVDDFAAHLDGRLNAFARVQAAVTRNPIAGLDLEAMVAEELYVYRAQEGRQVTRIEGPQVLLEARPAELIGLVLHELTTNAVKYGALGSENGRVAVDWEIVGEGEDRNLVLRWAESGVPLADPKPKRRGFGIELFERTLAYELGAQTQLELSPDGLRSTITLPLRNLTSVSGKQEARRAGE